MNDFITIDVETANENSATICQIGLAKFSNGELVESWSSLINPKSHFSDINISIHGITEEDVIDEPYIEDVSGQVISFISTTPLISHTAFDRTSLTKAFSIIGVESNFIWLDSARIARRAWEQFNKKGYGLANLAEFIGYQFDHHDALEDAKAAGYITLKAIEESGKSISDWVDILKNRYTNPRESIAQIGSIDGSLYGENIVFTGALSIPRKEASDLAAKAGCNVTSSVNTKTSLLVVGDQDIDRLAGHNKSTKHRKAEKLILSGQLIKILCETDFLYMIKQT